MVAPKIIIEVCVDSVDSALAAVRGSADRLELCANLGLGGGTTPSIGLLKAVQRAVPNTPIMALVRPRIGDFLYSASELDVMIEDIQNFKALGVAGVVLGVLTCGGRINVGHTKKLVHQALPMEVTFHRAVDMTVDYHEAILQLSNIQGLTRILTSGHSRSATDALGELGSSLCLVRQLSIPDLRNHPVKLLVGSGINPATVRVVLDYLLSFGLEEIHLTGGRWVEGEMWQRPEHMGMGAPGNEWSVWRTSEETIRDVRLQVEISCRK